MQLTEVLLAALFRNVVKCSDSRLKKGYDMQQRLGCPGFLIKTDCELKRSLMVCSPICIGTVLCINPTSSENSRDSHACLPSFTVLHYLLGHI